MGGATKVYKVAKTGFENGSKSTQSRKTNKFYKMEKKSSNQIQIEIDVNKKQTLAN